ncbi:HAD hydrolase family protein [Trueperella pecoris]|uniref:HAD hydrolase family protein n=1 Tax=Trueperella pecoris TaxID=2733571 RepID=UPI00186B8565|nr:HAD family hydrolase [Trueperella pecoris]QOQ38596.1 HAD family phosphatase [Trueperella pecoris]
MTIPLIDFAQLPWPRGLIKHAVFDIDGTLTDEHSVTSDVTIDALRRLDAAGLPITLATGRLLHGGANLVRRAGIHAWVIAAGGGVIWNGKDIVAARYMEPGQVEAISEFAERFGLVPFYFDEEEVYTDRVAMADTGMLRINENAGEGRPMLDLGGFDVSHATKVSLAAATGEEIDAVIDEVMAAFPETVRSHANFLDISAPGVTKWEGIERALAVRGLRAEDGLGVGDSDNDVAWLKRVGMPVAAPVASPAVRDTCRFALPQVNDAVARLIDAELARVPTETKIEND